MIFSSDTSVDLDLGTGVRAPRARLDLTATDLAADEQRLLALGATRPGHPSDTEQWIYMADPAGHLFSLTTVS